MKLEPNQATETLGLFLVEHALSDIPVFGPGKADVRAIKDDAMQRGAPEDELLTDMAANLEPLPESFTKADTIARKLQALRQYIWTTTRPDVVEDLNPDQIYGPLTLLRLQESPDGPAEHSSRSTHETLLKSTMETAGFPKEAQAVLDNVMLSRAREKYLFDCRTNRTVVDDDPWLKNVWGWIEGMASCCSSFNQLHTSLS